MVSGVQSGSAARSASVAIDSTFALLRCSGLKSKRTNGSAAADTSATTTPDGQHGAAVAAEKGLDRRQPGKAHLLQRCRPPDAAARAGPAAG